MLSVVSTPSKTASCVPCTATGVITYRETALLASAASSVLDLRYVAVVVAHEMAHQWFGNLVTMVRAVRVGGLNTWGPQCYNLVWLACCMARTAFFPWRFPHLCCVLCGNARDWLPALCPQDFWGELWLNEGFASYFEYVGATAGESRAPATPLRMLASSAAGPRFSVMAAAPRSCPGLRLHDRLRVVLPLPGPCSPPRQLLLLHLLLGQPAAGSPFRLQAQQPPAEHGARCAALPSGTALHPWLSDTTVACHNKWLVRPHPSS
jgi:hypothetical protein